MRRQGTRQEDFVQYIRADSSFERWVRECFERPLAGGACVCGTDLDHDFETPVQALEWRARLFASAGSLLHDYSNEQVAQGLDHLASHSHSDDMLALAAPSIPSDVRIRCLESFVPLFRDVFAVRCAPLLSSVPSSSSNPLNGVCYMWWDAMDYYPGPEEPGRRPVDLVAVRTMGELLDLESIACKESAVHGLGHWRHAYREQVEALLDAALASAHDWPPGLTAYAERARHSYVL